MNSDELNLIQRCLSDDRAAQQELYARYAPRMYMVCLRYCREEELAQDALQEGFIRAFRSLEQFKRQCPLEFWIRKIMVNVSLRQLERERKRQQTTRIEEADSEAYSSPQASAVQVHSHDLDIILDAIKRLPSGFRTIFNLFAIDGYSHKEIGEMLGISEGTSKSQYARARARLQKELSRLQQETTA